MCVSVCVSHLHLQSSSFRQGFGVHTRMEPDPCDTESGSDVVWNWDMSGMVTWNSDPTLIAGSEHTHKHTHKIIRCYTHAHQCYTT